MEDGYKLWTINTPGKSELLGGLPSWWIRENELFVITLMDLALMGSVQEDKGRHMVFWRGNRWKLTEVDLKDFEIDRQNGFQKEGPNALAPIFSEFFDGPNWWAS